MDSDSDARIAGLRQEIRQEISNLDETPQGDDELGKRRITSVTIMTNGYAATVLVFDTKKAPPLKTKQTSGTGLLKKDSVEADCVGAW
ncbi:hypothetical protein BGX28_000097 [Mortierella sp. GBA30]|nr:hypothetical protein BGX28_000097 [Mortierella sp. GBA30]